MIGGVTILVARDAKATNRPSGVVERVLLITTSPEAASPGEPARSQLTSEIAPVSVSRRNTSSAEFVSPDTTLLDAVLNTTFVPPDAHTAFVAPEVRGWLL